MYTAIWLPVVGRIALQQFRRWGREVLRCLPETVTEWTSLLCCCTCTHERSDCIFLTSCTSAAGYDLLLKVEYQGRTLWDCSGIPNPPNPSSNSACTIIPPGGLQAKLHLQVRDYSHAVKWACSIGASHTYQFCMQESSAHGVCPDLALLLCPHIWADADLV